MARPLTGTEPLDQRIQLMMSTLDVCAVDDWRFETRAANRSEAIRQLIRIGLDAYAEGRRTEPGGAE